MDIDEIQEKIEFTTEQQKAWNSLKRAVKKCEKSGIFFYQVLTTTFGMNGKHINGIICTEGDFDYDPILYTDGNSLQSLDIDSVNITDGFADDTHWLKMKGENK